MRQRRVRVIRHPDGYWFWICRAHGPDGHIGVWCIQESLTMHYDEHLDALDGAHAHARRHERDGSLILTADILLQII